MATVAATDTTSDHLNRYFRDIPPPTPSQHPLNEDAAVANLSSASTTSPGEATGGIINNNSRWKRKQGRCKAQLAKCREKLQLCKVNEWQSNVLSAKDGGMHHYSKRPLSPLDQSPLYINAHRLSFNRIVTSTPTQSHATPAKQKKASDRRRGSRVRRKLKRYSPSSKSNLLRR